MEVSPILTGKAFLKLVKERYRDVTFTSTALREELIARELFQAFQNILTETAFEDEECLEVDSANSDGSSFSQNFVMDDAGIEVNEERTDNCTLERKIEILKMIQAHPNYNLTSIHRVLGAKEFKSKQYKSRWEEQIRKGGTRFEQWKFIENYTYEKFVEARKQLKCVSGCNLKLWALQAAQTFRDPTSMFKASASWITRFKEKHSISSRKITKLVSKNEIANSDNILSATTTFQKEVKEMSKKFPAHLILNTDQVGFQYELTKSRTLSHIGEKLTVATSKSPKNLVTHSYTCEYVISLDGTIVGDVFICLQEPTGKLGDRVKETLISVPNVTVTCSASGKLTTSLYEYFLDQIIVKNWNEDFLFIVDSWSGRQTNAASYSERFGKNNSPSCLLKIIPKNCTSLCQPLDTTFHRQLKYFAKTICNEFTMNYSFDLHPTDEITTRNNIIRMHSLIHNQLTAPAFRPMIQYCWYSSGLTDDRPLFKSVKEICFEFNDKDSLICSSSTCEKSRFLKCSHSNCRKVLCLGCFFYQFHFHFD